MSSLYTDGLSKMTFKTFLGFPALAPAVPGLLHTNLPTFPRGWLGPVSAGAGSEPFKTR